MGRTLTSFNQLVRHLKDEEWGKFRRALRHEDQLIFDELFEMARFHAGPSVYASKPNPMEPIFLGMFVELLKRTAALEEKVREMEKTARENGRLDS